VPERKTVSLEDFVLELKTASAWEIHWAHDNTYLILRIKDSPEGGLTEYCSPNLLDLPTEVWQAFSREIDELVKSAKET
jgi:hypothetical protein